MQLSSEKGIPKEEVLKIVGSALAAAYKKEYCDKDEKIEAMSDDKKGGFTIYAKKLVVNPDVLKNPEEAKESALQELKNLDKTLPLQLEKGNPQESLASEELAGEDKEQSLIKFKPQRHILLTEAKKLLKDAALGDWMLFPLVMHDDYGRIAAQTAKQVIIQRLRELEYSLIFKSLKDKEGQMLSGIVQRIEGNTIFVDLGKATGDLIGSDQIAGERYEPNQRLKVYVSKVEQGVRGPAIFLSRSSAKALNQMFAQEVPEIASQVVEIKAIAREAGMRSKVAVTSHDPEVDPIGACVGQKGTRIAIIINEFNGEKIDVISYSEDPAQFILNALSPAKALYVRIDSLDKRHATAVVSEEQQSLAIGKKGQNVRLAAKLTGWKIDIRLPEQGMSAEPEVQMEENQTEPHDTPPQKEQASAPPADKESRKVLTGRKASKKVLTKGQVLKAGKKKRPKKRAS